MVRKKRSASKARKMHRSIGAIASIFVIFMVISGLVINHSNSLGLDQKHTSNTLVLDWYGLDKPTNIQSFRVGGHWMSTGGSQLFLDDEPVSSLSGLVGVVSSNDMLIAATGDEILLLDISGQLIERQAWKSFNDSPIDSIGLQSNRRAVLTSGSQSWSPDADFIKWKVIAEPEGPVSWSMSEDTPIELGKSITKQYRGKGLSLERVLLDLHSGRFFGTIGVLVYDLLALILGFLAISGLVLWFRGKRNGNQKPKHSKHKTMPTKVD